MGDDSKTNAEQEVPWWVCTFAVLLLGLCLWIIFGSKWRKTSQGSPAPTGRILPDGRVAAQNLRGGDDLLELRIVVEEGGVKACYEPGDDSTGSVPSVWYTVYDTWKYRSVRFLFVVSKRYLDAVETFDFKASSDHCDMHYPKDRDWGEWGVRFAEVQAKAPAIRRICGF